MQVAPTFPDSWLRIALLCNTIQPRVHVLSYHREADEVYGASTGYGFRYLEMVLVLERVARFLCANIDRRRRR